MRRTAGTYRQSTRSARDTRRVMYARTLIRVHVHAVRPCRTAALFPADSALERFRFLRDGGGSIASEPTLVSVFARMQNAGHPPRLATATD